MHVMIQYTSKCSNNGTGCKVVTDPLWAVHKPDLIAPTLSENSHSIEVQFVAIVYGAKMLWCIEQSHIL